MIIMILFIVSYYFFINISIRLIKKNKYYFNISNEIIILLFVNYILYPLLFDKIEGY